MASFSVQDFHKIGGKEGAVYFEPVVNIENTDLSEAEEDALHLIRKAKVANLFGLSPEKLLAGEIIEFLYNLKVEDDGTFVSRLTVEEFSQSSIPGRTRTKDVRISPTNIFHMYELNAEGQDPSLYGFDKEQAWLDRFAAEKVTFKGALHKRNLKPKYIVLNDLVAKCLLCTSGSLEQVSKPKLRLMAAIEDSPRVKFPPVI